MHKLLLGFIFSFLVLAAKAQNQVRLGLEYSPGFSHYLDTKKTPGLSDTPKFNYASGAKVIFELKDSLIFLETGFQYQKRGLTQTGIPGRNDRMDLDIDHVFYNVPILIRLEFSRWFVSFGPTLEKYSSINYTDNLINNKFKREPFLFGNFFSDRLGVEINLGHSFLLLKRVSLNPHVNFNMARFHRNGQFNRTSFMYNFEAGFSLLYGFNYKKEPIEQPKF